MKPVDWFGFQSEGPIGKNFLKLKMEPRLLSVVSTITK